ncbi:MAG: hypothetical protein Q8M51_15160, partial [Polaromonas sp.]|nr:hypothetical protein [Polaromonas sp.]
MKIFGKKDEPKPASSQTYPLDELEKFIDSEYEVRSAPINSRNIDLKAAFTEISEWKLEAKLEDNHRYFY